MACVCFGRSARRVLAVHAGLGISRRRRLADGCAPLRPRTQKTLVDRRVPETRGEDGAHPAPRRRRHRIEDHRLCEEADPRLDALQREQERLDQQARAAGACELERPAASSRRRPASQEHQGAEQEHRRCDQREPIFEEERRGDCATGAEHEHKKDAPASEAEGRRHRGDRLTAREPARRLLARVRLRRRRATGRWCGCATVVEQQHPRHDSERKHRQHGQHQDRKRVFRGHGRIGGHARAVHTPAVIVAASAHALGGGATSEQRERERDHASTHARHCLFFVRAKIFAVKLPL